MLGWTVFFVVLGILAGWLGFFSLAGLAATIAKICFVIFLVLIVTGFVMRAVRGQSVL